MTIATAQPRRCCCRCSIILPPLPLGRSAAPPPHRLGGTASVALPRPLGYRCSVPATLPLLLCRHRSAVTALPLPPLSHGRLVAADPSFCLCCRLVAPRLRRRTASVAPPPWLYRHGSAATAPPQHCSTASAVLPPWLHIRRPSSAAPPPSLPLHGRSAPRRSLRTRGGRSASTTRCPAPEACRVADAACRPVCAYSTPAVRVLSRTALDGVSNACRAGRCRRWTTPGCQERFAVVSPRPRPCRVRCC